MEQVAEKGEAVGSRTLAQFFFEIGYGSCWADAAVKLSKPPFELTDEIVERAWAVTPMCQDMDEDYAAFDANKALADAAPELLAILKAIDGMWSDDGEGGRVDPIEARSGHVREIWQQMRAAISRATAL